jgi:energy-coupling factor transporter ATP-binding protein EcfA2
VMITPKQRAANKLNSLKSTGPRSAQGKRRAAANAKKHSLSVPVDEFVFSTEIKKVADLIRDDCESDAQARALAKRIVNYERNEAYLFSQSQLNMLAEDRVWGDSPQRLSIVKLLQSHQNKQSVEVTFTTPNKQPLGKERTEEMKFIEDFLKLHERALLEKARQAADKVEASLRYRKRAINQLVKGLRAIATGEVL